MKTILYFHHAISEGGAPRSLSLLIKGLDRTRYRPIVVIPKRPGNGIIKQLFVDTGADVLEEHAIRPFNGSTVAPCDTLKDRGYAAYGLAPLVAAARKLVRRIEPDIVHLNSTCLVGAAIGARLAAPTTPVIAHVREPLLFNWWGRTLAGLNRRYVTHFIGIDRSGLDTLAAKQGSVVYNFVDETFFNIQDSDGETFRTRNGVDRGDIAFTSLSRIAPSNGILELLEVIKQRAGDLDQHARFVIAGFHDSINDYAREALTRIESLPQVIALPFTRNVHEALAGSDVVIAPYLTPHSARCIFEGAAARRPGLVTDLPNLMELVEAGTTGAAFEFSDPSSFTRSVNTLCNDEIRLKMGDAAGNRAKKLFSAQANVVQTCAIYDRLSGAA